LPQYRAVLSCLAMAAHRYPEFRITSALLRLWNKLKKQ
jgi:hypothetical protein